MKHFYFLQPILITIYFIVLSPRANPQSFTFAVIYFRDQSVFITWGGPDTFFLGGGRGYSLEDFVEGGGFKNAYCPVEFAILISNVS